MSRLRIRYIYIIYIKYIYCCTSSFRRSVVLCNRVLFEEKNISQQICYKYVELRFSIQWGKVLTCYILLNVFLKTMKLLHTKFQIYIIQLICNRVLLVKVFWLSKHNLLIKQEWKCNCKFHQKKKKNLHCKLQPYLQCK